MNGSDRNALLVSRLLSAASLMGAMTIIGCGNQSTTSQGFEVETPRVTPGGVILEEGETTREDALSQIASALDSINEPSINPGVMSSIRDRVADRICVGLDQRAEHQSWGDELDP